ncbi:MAG: MFS transporter [Calditrichaeota bacterium]|nr:MAG: MFS transporter [Calditrichota bacterium]MBL1207911.1 MFS transporter [Calditrichota bacterium]NOG47746.1 MFS transporter [Calditrichota bacterium]
MIKDKQYYKFCLYGFLKNLRFFEPFFILFFLSKDLTFLQIGTLYATREIAINLFEIPSGIIADTLGRRKTLASSFMVYILAFIIFYGSSNFGLFILAMLFYALGDAIRSGINKAMIVDYLKRTGQQAHKIKYYGHTRSWSQFGSALSSLAGGILYFFNQNLDTIFLFSIIPYVLDFANVLTYPKYLDKSASESRSVMKDFREISASFLQSLKNSSLLKALINSSIYSGYYKSIKDFIQPFLKTLVIQLPFLLFLNNEEKTAILLGAIYFLIFIGNSVASRKTAVIADKFKSAHSYLNKTLVVGIFLGLISGLIMQFYISVWAILLFIIILLIENARKPAGIVVITDHSDERIHAGVLSVTSQIRSGFSALFVLAIGLFADIYGVGAGIVIVSGMMLVTLPFYKLK